MQGIPLGSELTAEEVHATVCMVVTAQAIKHSAWAEYASILLDPETEVFFKTRLLLAATLTEEAALKSQPPSTLPAPGDGRSEADSVSDIMVPAEEAVSSEPRAVLVCDHCGGVVPEVAISVACLDGSRLALILPQCSAISDVKRKIGQVGQLGIGSQPLFTYFLPKHLSRVTWTLG